MGDQTPQRRDLLTQTAQECANLIRSLNRLNDLVERKVYMGAFVTADLTGTDLAYLDTGTANLIFDRVIPAMNAAFNHQAFNDADGFQLVVASNAGRNKQILEQLAKTI